MKIGILIDELISGGFQKVAVMETHYFQKLGYEVSLVVLHRIEHPGYQDIIKKSGIDVICLSDRLPWYFKINFHFPLFAFFSFFHISYPLFVHRYIKKNEFDIFVTHGTYTAFSSITILKKLGIPYICFDHDPIAYILPQKYQNKFLGKLLWFLTPIAKSLDKAIIKNAKAVIAFPDMVVEMRKIYPSYQNYNEIFNGCEILPEGQLNYQRENYAIAVTKWDQGKNFELLLDVWKQLELKIPLKIIGTFARESIRAEYTQAIKDANLENSIEIVGSVSEEILGDYYQKAKLLIHPCREAFGMTILEAAANGCPAIFSNNSGVAELFSENIKQILPKENDADGYLFQIKNILSLNKEGYADFSRDYYATAIRNSWENHCKKIVSLINA
jgi:glycosyltransferase involved in cell wall biosynthesis